MWATSMVGRTLLMLLAVTSAQAVAPRLEGPDGSAYASASNSNGGVQEAVPFAFGNLRLNCAGCGSLSCYAYTQSVPANTSIITRATLAAPATIRTDKSASYKPSTKEVLAWVSSHFGIPAGNLQVAKPTKTGDYTDTFKVNKKSVKVRHVRIQQVQSWASTFNPNTDFGPLSVEFGFIAVHLDKNNVLAVTGGYIPSLFTSIAAAPSSRISPAVASSFAAGAALAAAPDIRPDVAKALRAAAGGDPSALATASIAAAAGGGGSSGSGGSGGSGGGSGSGGGAIKSGGTWIVGCFDSGCGPVWKENYFLPPGAGSQPRSLDVYIDAFTGNKRLVIDNLKTVSAAVGIGHSLYAGQVKLPTGKGPKNANGGQYELTNFKVNKKGMTLDWNNNPDATNDLNFLLAATLFRSADNTWGSGTTASDTDVNRQTAAVDAHYGVGLVYQYYLQVHGRKGLDNKNTPIDSFVHVGKGYNNAFYNAGSMFFGDGSRLDLNGCNGFTPLTPLDIVAHEVTHGITDFSAQLAYTNSFGGLNEGISDVFSQCVVDWAQGQGLYPQGANFLIGAEMYANKSCTTPFLRSMSNPPVDGGLSFGCWDPSIDQRIRNVPVSSFDAETQAHASPDNFCEVDVHHSSGVLNRWFYLLASGFTKCPNASKPASIGIATSCSIVYRALTQYFTPTSDFFEARAATTQAAADLHGTNSPEVSAVKAAWDVVGVPTAPDGTRPTCDAIYATAAAC